MSATVCVCACRRQGWRRGHEELTSRHFVLSRVVAREPNESGSDRLAGEVAACEAALQAGTQHKLPIDKRLQSWLGSAICLYGYSSAAAVTAAVLDTMCFFISCRQPRLFLAAEQLLPQLDQLDSAGRGRWQRLLQAPEIREVLPLLLVNNKVVLYHSGLCQPIKELRQEVGVGRYKLFIDYSPS